MIEAAGGLDPANVQTSLLYVDLGIATTLVIYSFHL